MGIRVKPLESPFRPLWTISMRTTLNFIVRVKSRISFCVVALLSMVIVSPASGNEADSTTRGWQLGRPIVTYWAGPPLTEALAAQLAEGGWNLVWARESELDIAAKYQLRAQLQDELLTPESLENPARRVQLDALIDRVSYHPALYSYFLRDEPNARDFPALGKLVAYLKQRDPRHLAYINLFPTYATNEQLGTKGDVITAYREYLRLYLEIVQPQLISYDHYQFRAADDGDQYFLNLALIREYAIPNRLPFLNIVQACSWTPAMRVPTGDELRYLVYTSLAYGAQGISYYVYSWPNHTGGMANQDGTPTPLYHAAKRLNHEFVTIAEQLQPLSSIGVYHTGIEFPGTTRLPSDVPFQLAKEDLEKPFVLGLFGPDRQSPTHVLLVNLNYKQEITAHVHGPGLLEVFDIPTKAWRLFYSGGVLAFPPGGGFLLRSQDVP